MNGDPGSLEQQLAELNQQYLRRLQQELPELQWLLLQLVQADSSSWREQATHLLMRFHTLAGSAGSFGLTDVGAVAKSIELQFKSYLQQQQLPTREDLAKLQSLFITMQQAAGQPKVQISSTAKPCQLSSADASVLLLCKDPSIVQTVNQTLKTFGHRVECYADLAELLVAARAEPPEVVIVDLDAFADTAHTYTQLSTLICPLGQPVPLFVLSAHDDFQHYLQAVRAGGQAYFVKPLHPTMLEARLQRLLSAREREAFRVLIVDDDMLLAQHYALVLQNAGLEAEILTDPAEVFQGLRRFNPDVMLLDVNMPQCSGPELAQIIRLQDEWLGVPIIYLSSETDSERQMASLVKAGDDFLTKPISDNALVVAIFARAQRARQLSEVMTKDSLTGLLQHAHIKERLGAELERAVRQQQNVSVVMLDIDHFKKVNDLYGHLIGDQVISSLANLLKQQLRKTDLLGRYGGEEFLMVLPECPLDRACQIVNQLREAFSRIPFVSHGQTFYCTFSAGVTSGSDSQQVDVVVEHADQALYQAKGAGRNQVHLYQPPVSLSPHS